MEGTDSVMCRVQVSTVFQVTSIGCVAASGRLIPGAVSAAPGSGTGTTFHIACLGSQSQAKAGDVERKNNCQ